MLNILLHKRVVPILLFLTAMVAVGILVFMQLEDWTFIEAFYFTVSTMSTVGYGDIAPTTELSRFIATIYMIIMIPTIFVSLGVVADTVFTYRTKTKPNKKIKKK